MIDHGFFCALHITHVGASSLAMVVNDNAGWLVPRGVLGFIASRLAPTEGASAPALKAQNPMI